ncbi:PEGA domain-containing protein [Polyangium aurulentum]|uniref:PEGA domain-containing protein n=1 Tax=Polyangium aurulentum TaxID=2567896 RepID=UPI0010AE3A55|nr:PEGA domain-containing protein [Polyangium aurulentum]UQA57894.1 PEGA domain-containing protein [Polyangium aurulentum]
MERRNVWPVDAGLGDTGKTGWSRRAAWAALGMFAAGMMAAAPASAQGAAKPAATPTTTTKAPAPTTTTKAPAPAPTTGATPAPTTTAKAPAPGPAPAPAPTTGAKAPAAAPTTAATPAPATTAKPGAPAPAPTTTAKGPATPAPAAAPTAAAQTAAKPGTPAAAPTTATPPPAAATPGKPGATPAPAGAATAAGAKGAAAVPAATGKTPADPKAAPAADPKAAATPADPKATPGAAADAKAQVAPAADTEKEAAKKYDEGVKHLKAEQWEKARESLAAAYQLKATPDTALGLAKAEMQLGKPRDAAEHVSFYLREAKDAKPQDRQAAEKLFTDAKTKVGTLNVTADMAAAEVLVDGKAVGKTPLTGPVFIEPGKHTLEARKEGVEPVKQPVEVIAGGEGSVNLVLTPPPKPLPPPPPPAVATGPAPRNKIIIYAGIGTAGALGLVGIGTAIGAAVAGSNSYSTWEENGCARTNPQCVADFNSTQDTKSALGNTAFWTLLGGVAVGAGTAVYALTGPKSNAPRTAFVVAPGGGAVMVTGSF